MRKKGKSEDPLYFRRFEHDATRTQPHDTAMAVEDDV